MHIQIWDILLLITVPTMATAIAYLHKPKHKALVLTLPIPFTIATMALGQEVTAVNVLALLLLLGFSHAVRWLHAGLHLPIVPSIVLSAAAYVLTGALLMPIIPTTAPMFWGASLLVLVVAILMQRYLPHRDEPGHRSRLPVWVKFPLIFLVIAGLVSIKKYLAGFMPVFPMVGVVAAYEARHCLWTICRQIPVIMLTILPMLVILRLLAPHIGLGMAFVPAWMAFACTLWVMESQERALSRQ